MAEMFKLEIVTPSGIVHEGEVKHVRAPGVEGSFGVMRDHTPFITPLQVGVIEADTPSGPTFFATSGGLAEVHGDHTVILAETCEQKDKIDLARAEAAKQRAEKRLETSTEEVDVDRARLALMRAINRIGLAGN